MYVCMYVCIMLQFSFLSHIFSCTYIHTCVIMNVRMCVYKNQVQHYAYVHAGRSAV
jgi:hypothetical protein